LHLKLSDVSELALINLYFLVIAGFNIRKIILKLMMDIYQDIKKFMNREIVLSPAYSAIREES